MIAPQAPSLVPEPLAGVGVVVIGRNEGQRLAACLEPLAALGVPVVYADSGSSDGSPALARRLGVELVELDGDSPYTAARGRNAGFQHLLAGHPQLRLVQFVDGDCRLVPGWLEQASAALQARPDVAVVAGRLREQHPQQSIYHRLCDMEWDVPAGPTESCGGNCMVRVEAFLQAGGFNPALIAGEEPELAWRLRHAGARLVRLEQEMAVHDAEMPLFRQWWRRQVRAGHAAAENADLHGRSDRRHYVRDVVSNLAYGLALPGLALGLLGVSGGLSLSLLAAYPLLYMRVRGHRLRRGAPLPDAEAYARYLVLGKFAQTAGTLKYFWRRKLWRRVSTLIEYKHLGARTRRR